MLLGVGCDAGEADPRPWARTVALKFQPPCPALLPPDPVLFAGAEQMSAVCLRSIHGQLMKSHRTLPSMGRAGALLLGEL